MADKATEYVKELNLQTHPEGGYFREIYKSDEIINQSALPSHYKNDRSLCTLIYYLLEGTQKSNFHILKSDEIWHHLDGDTLEIHTIDQSGTYNKISLGKDISNGELLQYVIPRNTWFAAGLKFTDTFVLVGCTVVPGFDFEDFKLAERVFLKELFPAHKRIITKFTK